MAFGITKEALVINWAIEGAAIFDMFRLKGMQKRCSVVGIVAFIVDDVSQVWCFDVWMYSTVYFVVMYVYFLILGF